MWMTWTSEMIEVKQSSLWNNHLAYLSLEVLHCCLESFRTELRRHILPINHNFSQDSNTGFDILRINSFLKIEKTSHFRHNFLAQSYSTRSNGQKTTHPLLVGLCILSQAPNEYINSLPGELCIVWIWYTSNKMIRCVSKQRKKGNICCTVSY